MADLFITTTCATEKYTCLWSIRDFSKLLKKDIEIKSPKFSSEQWIGKRQWQLILSTMKMDKENKPWVAFNLVNITTEDNASLIETTIKISIGFSRSDIPISERSYSYPNTAEDHNFKNFLPHNRLLELEIITHQDTLNMFCEILVSSSLNVTHTVSQIKHLECFPDSKQLGADLAQMLATQSMCDVTILAGEEMDKFKAHKTILAARSSVFNAMFKHEMQENIESIIEIKDLSAKVVQEMLNYIYTATSFCKS